MPSKVFGVLVSETMPNGLDILGRIDDIWVCSLDGFRGLSQALRESIIRISDAVVPRITRVIK